MMIRSNLLQIVDKKKNRLNINQPYPARQSDGPMYANFEETNLSKSTENLILLIKDQDTSAKAFKRCVNSVCAICHVCFGTKGQIILLFFYLLDL